MVVAFSAVAFALFVGLRLAFAYSRYLRFPHALATAVASQVIAFLLALFWAAAWARRL
jgi:hypothetical protein